MDKDMKKSNETLLKLVIVLVFIGTVVGNIFFLPNAFLALRGSTRPQWGGKCSLAFPSVEEKLECYAQEREEKKKEQQAQTLLVGFRLFGIVSFVLSVISLSLGKSKSLAKKYIVFSGLAVFLSCILIL